MNSRTEYRTAPAGYSWPNSANETSLGEFSLAGDFEIRISATSRIRGGVETI
jgi:hypothetical protein